MRAQIHRASSLESPPAPTFGACSSEAGWAHNSPSPWPCHKHYSTHTSLLPTSITPRSIPPDRSLQLTLAANKGSFASRAGRMQLGERLMHFPAILNQLHLHIPATSSILPSFPYTHLHHLLQVMHPSLLPELHRLSVSPPTTSQGLAVLPHEPFAQSPHLPQPPTPSLTPHQPPTLDLHPSPFQSPSKSSAPCQTQVTLSLTPQPSSCCLCMSAGKGSTLLCLQHQAAQRSQFSSLQFFWQL